MYFELTSQPTRPIDWDMIRAALLRADPSAGIHLEPQHARLRVDGGLGRAHIERLLQEAGYSASYLPHEQGGSTCCGGCG